VCPDFLYSIPQCCSTNALGAELDCKTRKKVRRSILGP
jgi:hypothetical protein